MTARESRPTEVEPEIEALPEARCPECGSEEIERIEHPRLPPDHRGRCTECDHRTSPLAFHHCWKWVQMSDKEREQARRRRERHEDKLAEYQYSATYLAEQRGA
ncbi:hypothetical protein [Halococcus salifodinae]|uniref:Uncharacterized protein n=1 Tax=Halococcus salifodinae DSM 8989 TaxID=1227456 RepID=M0MPZ0_9EURY|nr:hypothetical protein [Halococcus salifodinae]EMA47782.1 hypothetical protein C450_20726 [Halococcus salifodinae DSM 8989]